MAAAAAAAQPLPGCMLPPAAPATLPEGASGHGSTAGLGVEEASMQAEIEALLRFEEPLLPELHGLQPDSSSWLGMPAPPGWQQGGPAEAAAAGLGGAAAALPLLPTMGS